MIADGQVVKENIFECFTSLPFIDYLTILKCYYRSIRIFALFFTSFLMYIYSTVMLLSRINLKWTFEVRNQKNVVINVSEHMGWVRNVALMNVYSGSGKPRGVGILGRGGARWAGWGKYKGQFTSNLRERWTDPNTARRVPSKWKRGTKGNKGSKGNIVYITYLSYVYIRTNAVMNDTSCILHNNNDRNECC